MNIGTKIQEYRIKSNLSIEDLADKLSITEDTINSWESNKEVPNESKLYELAAIYKVSLDELLGEYKDKLISPKTKAQKRFELAIKIITIFGYIFMIGVIIILIYGFISTFTK